VKRSSVVTLVFLLLSALGWYYSGIGPVFLCNEVLTRFIRDAVLVLALLIPIAAGMGINFAITVGAMSAQVGFLTAIIMNIWGLAGLSVTLLVTLVAAIVTGWLVGLILNRVKGKEMITTIIIGFLANGLYQFVYLVGYGTFIPAFNQEILLSRGIGVRNMVDLAGYRNLMENIWMIEVGDIHIPLFMIMVVLLFCVVVAYIMNTRFGQRVRAVGQDMEKAAALGIDVNKTRLQAIILSTVLAGLGQILYLQNIGMINVYTAHMNSDIFSAAALLAGGATLKEARVRNVILGIFLFHTLFIVSPQAGQNLLGNAALGEYFRSFVAYGTIALALVFNETSQNIRGNKLCRIRNLFRKNKGPGVEPSI